MMLLMVPGNVQPCFIVEKSLQKSSCACCHGFTSALFRAVAADACRRMLQGPYAQFWVQPHVAGADLNKHDFDVSNNFRIIARVM